MYPMIAHDRRASPRHPAVANRARLEWLEGGELRGSPARLVDIGAGGSLLVADDPPPLYQAVWLRIHGPTGTDEARATVVRHAGADLVGVAFPGRCPYDLHLAATLGVNPFERLCGR